MLMTAAAGAVDAVSYLMWGGVFTSVMTANSALLGVGLGQQRPALAALAAMAIAAYLLGVAAGSGLAAARRPRWAAGITGPLTVECLALWGVAASWLATDGAPGTAVRTALQAVAAWTMGCQSGAVRVVLGSRVTTAYMTGAMTGVVVDLTVNRRLQRRTTVVLLLLVAGALAAGAAARWVPVAAPALPAALITAALATTAARSPAGADGRDGARGRRPGR
ncbi:DUF1275 family protein [Streptomyces sp. NPDC004065]|uniref:DUF1275 family protein n=1 Tax=Streptomyces sp. NPDC004065 TaxID=3364689 RepID=UPI003850BA5B